MNVLSKAYGGVRDVVAHVCAAGIRLLRLDRLARLGMAMTSKLVPIHSWVRQGDETKALGVEAAEEEEEHVMVTEVRMPRLDASCCRGVEELKLSPRGEDLNGVPTYEAVSYVVYDKEEPEEEQAKQVVNQATVTDDEVDEATASIKKHRDEGVREAPDVEDGDVQPTEKQAVLGVPQLPLQLLPPAAKEDTERGEASVVGVDSVPITAVAVSQLSQQSREKPPQVETPLHEDEEEDGVSVNHLEEEEEVVEKSRGDEGVPATTSLVAPATYEMVPEEEASAATDTSTAPPLYPSILDERLQPKDEEEQVVVHPTTEYGEPENAPEKEHLSVLAPSMVEAVHPESQVESTVDERGQASGLENPISIATSEEEEPSRVAVGAEMDTSGQTKSLMSPTAYEMAGLAGDKQSWTKATAETQVQPVKADAVASPPMEATPAKDADDGQHRRLQVQVAEPQSIGEEEEETHEPELESVGTPVQKGKQVDLVDFHHSQLSKPSRSAPLDHTLLSSFSDSFHKTAESTGIAGQVVTPVVASAFSMALSQSPLARHHRTTMFGEVLMMKPPHVMGEQPVARHDGHEDEDDQARRQREKSLSMQSNETEDTENDRVLEEVSSDDDDAQLAGGDEGTVVGIAPGDDQEEDAGQEEVAITQTEDMKVQCFLAQMASRRLVVEPAETSLVGSGSGLDSDSGLEEAYSSSSEEEDGDHSEDEPLPILRSRMLSVVYNSV